MAKPPDPQRCGNCMFLRVLPDSDGVQRIRKDRDYQCVVPIPDMTLVLPASVTQAYGYYAPRQGGGTAMMPYSGTTCPTWQRRV